MHRTNDAEMWHERRQALPRDAGNARPARRLEEGRPKREGSHPSGKMRRRSALLLSTTSLAEILAAGAAYSLDVQRSLPPGAKCASAPSWTP